jgi:hypothetical protein
MAKVEQARRNRPLYYYSSETTPTTREATTTPIDQTGTVTQAQPAIPQTAPISLQRRKRTARTTEAGLDDSGDGKAAPCLRKVQRPAPQSI